jgi:hypothetical protein
MNSQNSWRNSFVDWVRRELQSPPSSRKLVDLLARYPGTEADNISSQDWVEENLEVALEFIKAENTFEVIYDKAAPDSTEFVSIRLYNEQLPNIRNISQPRSQDNLQQPSLDLLIYRIDKLEGSLDSAKSLLEKLHQDIGSRNNFSNNLFEWLRSNEPRINKITEIDSSLTKISRSLALHIGEHDFKSESDTFKTHYDHILFAFPSGKWKENGWIWLILGVLVATCVGVTSIAVSYKANFENQLKNMEEKIKRLESRPLANQALILLGSHRPHPLHLHLQILAAPLNQELAEQEALVLSLS